MSSADFKEQGILTPIVSGSHVNLRSLRESCLSLTTLSMRSKYSSMKSDFMTREILKLLENDSFKTLHVQDFIAFKLVHENDSQVMKRTASYVIFITSYIFNKEERYFYNSNFSRE